MKSISLLPSKRFREWARAGILSLPLCLVPGISLAENEGEESEEDEDPNPPSFRETFESRKPGQVPADFFVLDGDWALEKIDESVALKLAGEPLAESQIQFGKSMKETGGRIRARIHAERKRRSLPRFGVGLHGVSGYRLRIFPVQERLELIRADEVIQSVELDWRPGEWWFLELSAEPSGDAWTVTGRAWAESAARPESPQIDYISTETQFFGRPSVTGTPFAGLPIWFDEIEVWRTPESEEENDSVD